MEEFPVLKRHEPILSGPERDQLVSWLDFYRATLLKKFAGLSLEQLSRTPVATSSMSLLGILRHMAFVEQVWFDVCFAGDEVDLFYKPRGPRRRLQ